MIWNSHWAWPTSSRCFIMGKFWRTARRTKCAQTNKCKAFILGRRICMLEISELHSNYGEATVLRGVNLHVPEGQVTGLLGRNGMGKTTLIRSIMRLTP